jgi:hypothetical protein
MILIAASYKKPTESVGGNNWDSIRTVRSPNMLESIVDRPKFNIDEDDLSKAEYWRTFARTCYR